MTKCPKERHNDKKQQKTDNCKRVKEKLKGKMRIRMTNCNNNGKMTNIAGIANAVICPIWL